MAGSGVRAIVRWLWEPSLRSSIRLVSLRTFLVSRHFLSARRGLRASAKQTQVLGLSWHGGRCVLCFRHLLSTRRCSASRSWDTFVEQKTHSFETIFVECVPHLKQSLENERK